MGTVSEPGKLFWYPSYIGDILSVTALMSPHEVCAYFLITTHLWNSGGALPADDSKLARIANLTPDEWDAAKPTLLRIFKVKSGTLAQSEVTDGIKKARGKIEQASKAGQASAASRRRKLAAETATGVERPLNGRSNETATGVVTGEATGRATNRATNCPTKRQPRASEGEGALPREGFLGDTYVGGDGGYEPFVAAEAGQ